MRASDVRFKFPYLFKIKINNNLSNISSIFVSLGNSGFGHFVTNCKNGLDVW